MNEIPQKLEALSASLHHDKKPQAAPRFFGIVTESPEEAGRRCTTENRRLSEQYDRTAIFNAREQTDQSAAALNLARSRYYEHIQQRDAMGLKNPPIPRERTLIVFGKRIPLK